MNSADNDTKPVAAPYVPEARVTDEPAPRVRKALARESGRENGLITVEPLRKQDIQPSYQSESTYEVTGWYASMINCLGTIAGTLGSIPCCICCPNPYKEVLQGNVGLISKFGKFYRSVDPGLVAINPFSEKVKMVNVQIQVSAIPRQTVLTRDNVTLFIDSVLYFHINNPYKAAFAIQDIRTALVERAQSTMRQVVGARLLQNLIVEREEIAHEIEEILEQAAETWGVEIESILIKDIIFSEELQQSLSSAAQQKRVGEAKVIAARAEVDAARLMREAADILDSKAAMQIRQLEALQQMARASGSKVIFVPMNLLEGGASAGSSAPVGSGPMHSAQLTQLANM